MISNGVQKSAIDIIHQANLVLRNIARNIWQFFNEKPAAALIFLDQDLYIHVTKSQIYLVTQCL